MRVNINDVEAASAALREQVIPRIQQLSGFVTGYWTRKDSQGLSLLVFASEEAAEQAAGQIPAGILDAVTLDSIEVGEVVAHT